MKTEQKIREYLENLKPQKIGLKEKIKIKSIKHLGHGSSNINYLFTVKSKKFIFRLNVYSPEERRSEKEFIALKAVEHLRIAPKCWLLDNSRKNFEESFIILEYIYGKSLDELKNSITPKIISRVARLTAKLHNLDVKDINALHINREGYLYYIKELKEYKGQFKELIDNPIFFELLDDIYKKLDKLVFSEKERKYPLSLIHSDIQEQNLIKRGNTLYLIDWEGLNIADPAWEVAYIFCDFGRPFKKNERQVFYKEYLKLRKDATLKERIKLYEVIRYADGFLWAIIHALRVKHNKVSKEFSQRTNLESHVKFAEKVFKRALNAGVIDKKFSAFNLRKEVFR